MEPETNNEQSTTLEQPSKFEQLHKVTPLSKHLAMALFILMPFIGGWIGYNYAPEKVVEKIVIIEEGHADRDSADSYLYISEAFGFGVQIPLFLTEIRTDNSDRIATFTDGNDKPAASLRISERETAATSYEEFFAEVRSQYSTSTPGLQREVDFDQYEDERDIPGTFAYKEKEVGGFKVLHHKRNSLVMGADANDVYVWLGDGRALVFYTNGNLDTVLESLKKWNT